MACCTTAHMPSRNSLIIFISCSRAHDDLVICPKYSVNSALVRFGVELTVDAEVAEVEEHVVHPGVLEVEQPHPVVGEQHVARQQVVVARHRSASATWRTLPRSAGSAGADARTRVGPSRREQSVAGVPLDDPMDRECAAERAAVVESMDRGRPHRRAARRTGLVRDGDRRRVR